VPAILQVVECVHARAKTACAQQLKDNSTGCVGQMDSAATGTLMTSAGIRADCCFLSVLCVGALPDCQQDVAGLPS
jgi:hypothetical protein